jgi:hypothetical protein
MNVIESTLFDNNWSIINQNKLLKNNNQINHFKNKFFTIYDTDKNLLVIETKTKKQILIFYYNNINEINYPEETFDYENNNQNKILIYKKNIYQIHITIFYDMEWYIVDNNKIIELNLNPIINNMLNYCVNLDKNICYYFLLENSNFFDIGVSDLNISNVYFLYACYKYKNSIIFNNITDFNTIELYSKEKFISDYSELLSSSTKNKNLLNLIGYNVQIYNYKYNKFTYYNYKIQKYKYIVNIFPKNENKYVNYLELYQKKILKNIIHLIHAYYYDIIKIINSSLKTLGKEILNIYFLTRNKQNIALYSLLTSEYKKTIYNLHSIYISNKYPDDNINYIKNYNYNNNSKDILFDCDNDSFDSFKINNSKKNSITLNTIYNYFKSINVYDLKKLFDSRKIIIEKIKKNTINYNKIFYTDQIEIVVLSELLNS